MLHTLRLIAQEDLFEFLELPWLRRFRFIDRILRNQRQINLNVQGCLARFFSRSYATTELAELKELEIASHSLSDQDITQALFFVPNLNILRVLAHLSDNGFHALTISSSTSLCRNLRTLEWHLFVWDQCSSSAFVSMSVSRWGGSDPSLLSAVANSMSDQVREELLQISAIGNAVREGARLTILMTDGDPYGRVINTEETLYRFLLAPYERPYEQI